jgi:glutaredoxin
VSDIYNILPLIEKISNKFIKCDKWFNLSLTPNNILYGNVMAPYISLDTKSKKEILQYYSKNYESYLARGILPIMPQRDAIFHYFSINGDCSHKDIQKSLRNRVSTASRLGIHIIGSEKCPYTIKAEKLLRTRGTPFTKEYYASIGEALQNTGTKTIPAIYNSGILIGGYDDLHSLLKKS